MGSIQYKETPETSSIDQEICEEFKWFIQGHKIINTLRELISFGAAFTQQSHSINHLLSIINGPGRKNHL